MSIQRPDNTLELGQNSALERKFHLQSPDQTCHAPLLAVLSRQQQNLDDHRAQSIAH
jgi:hypothetical protein